ncbi:MAG: aminotransferase class I/II-fold pyridoxal phosphate-dependent enzyme [Actinomycetota bacterium]
MEQGPWSGGPVAERVAEVRRSVAGLDLGARVVRVEALVAAARQAHEDEAINLNPATNVMLPRAEALLSAGIGTRPSLGHPGAKYETGLEDVEQIEVVAADLTTEVFGARFAELRVASGSIANLYAFLATCSPGDAVIVPPASIGGHVTHHLAGAAGLAHLRIHEAPVDVDRFTVDVDGLAALAERVRPAMITVGGSLNLAPHPVAQLRAIADEHDAALLFDAAHLAGMLAGGMWRSPLAAGADLVTMSTYKSLAGPPAGLVLTDRADLARRLDEIAHPGLTANFDVAKTAALAVTMAAWASTGEAYARAMVETAVALSTALGERDLPVVRTADGWTASHQLAVDASAWGGGQAAAARLRRAGLLASGIGLPFGTAPDGMPGLRLGTNELLRWGMGAAEMPELAGLVADALTGEPEAVLPRTLDLRGRYRSLHHLDV